MTKNYKIFSTIKALKRREVRQIKKMLHSKLYSSRTDMKELFDLLTEMLLDRKTDLPTPESVYASLYPNKEFNYLQLRGTMSDLLEMIEKYWLNEMIAVDEIQAKLHLCKIYRERKLEKNYKSAAKKLERLVESFPYRNTKYYEHQLAVAHEVLKRASDSERENYRRLKEISFTEDVLFLAKKLRTACAQLSYQLVQKSEADFGVLPDLLKKVDQEKYLEIPTIAIYYYCFQFLTESDEPAHFQKFKSTLSKYRHLFSIEDLSGPYRLAVNYCIRKSNEGATDYVREVWELYKNGLDEGILLMNDRIPRFTFDNALSVGIRLKEYDWARAFIDDYATKLEPALREQSITFNLAKLAFEQDQHDQALIYLQQADFKDLRINIVGKILLIKIYFQLDSHDALQAHMDNFLQFVRRKEINDYHRKNVMNIIRYMKKITNSSVLGKIEKQQIKDQIAAEAVLSEKDWLLSRI